MENSARLHPNVALEILACTMDVAKTLDQGSTVLAQMTTLELDVSTSMTLVRLALARMVQLVSTKDLDSLVFVLQGIQVIGLTILQRFFNENMVELGVIMGLSFRKNMRGGYNRLQRELLSTFSYVYRSHW